MVRCLWDAPFRRHLKVQFEALFVGVFLRHLKHLATLAARHGDGAADIIQVAHLTTNELFTGERMRTYLDV